MNFDFKTTHRIIPHLDLILPMRHQTLRLQGYDIQKLEDQIFREEVVDNTVYESSLFMERHHSKHRSKIKCSTK